MDTNLALQKQWWEENSRTNFFTYRQYIRSDDFKFNWFIIYLSLSIQKFYAEYKAGKRPILIISCPPQHGKSWGVEDAVSWLAGLDPNLRLVYASFSDSLGVRCNTGNQRVMMSDKYHGIFPNTNINIRNVVTQANLYKKNSALIEFIGNKGSFRNTTVGGPITGESLDIGFIDDPFKGRKEANSPTQRNTVWNWFTDDFGTRFSDSAGYIITMTRWHTDDLVGRIKKEVSNVDNNVTEVRFAAIAEQDEKYRKAGEALFPELKSLSFLKSKRKLMLNASWQSLYQGNPIVVGGSLIQPRWFQWWETLPQMSFTFAVADTAQKVKTINDYTCMQAWGYGVDGCIYLLDMLHLKLTEPQLRVEAELFYMKHNKPVKGGPFRGFCIEDKSSGIGLIQYMQSKKFKVFPIPRTVDKIERSDNVGPEIRAGRVLLSTTIPETEVLLIEVEQFPNGKFDDAWDCTMSGIEVAYIYPELINDTVFIS